MRWLLFLVVGLLLASCGPTAVLYTDDLFRASAPEVVEAWKSLSPWKSARSIELPAGAGLAALEADLAASPPPDRLLVGLALTAAEGERLQSSHPTLPMVFFQTPPPGAASVTVLRAEAWAAVAQAAAVPGGAVVLYPSNATTAEVSQFDSAWKSRAGGPLTTAAGYRADVLTGPPAVVIHWAGSEMDGPVGALPPTTVVHGNPGMARPQGAPGLTWGIQKAGLGDFLWQVAVAGEKKPHFLPLETVLDRR